MKLTDKKIKNIITKSLNETLEEKANRLTSKIKGDMNELGGMPPDVQDYEHPFANLGPDTPEEKIKQIYKKYYGKDYSEYKGDKGKKEDNNNIKDSEYKGDKGKKEDNNNIEDNENFKGFKRRKDYGGMAEGWDSEEMYMQTDGEDYNPKKYKKFPIGKGKSKMDNRLLDKLTGSEPEGYDKDRFDDLEFAEGESSMCECGSGMNEGECTECGGYKTAKFGKSKFDYVEQMNEDSEENEFMGNDDKEPMEKVCERDGEYSQSCKSMRKYYKNRQKVGGELDEKLYGKQRNLDHNKNGRIDSEDLRMARQKGRKRETDGEVEEGNAFTGALDDARDEGKKTFKVGNKEYKVKGKNSEVHESYKKCKICGMKNCKCNHKKNKKEKVKLTENELIDLIESVVLEQKEKLKNKGGQPRGYQKYKQSHDKSGKENKEYLNSVSKKMKDYLKDGSNGDFDMNPKMFPSGNGELKKMKKKAYQISDEGKEFLDRYQRPGMENLDYDEIHPNEDWMTDTIEGSERTGNSPKYANAVETSVNKNINKKRKSNEYAKAKRAAFQKAPQPVINDKTGDEDGTGLHIDLGKSSNKSTGKKTEKVNEEFDRMKDLISYNRKTQ